MKKQKRFVASLLILTLFLLLPCACSSEKTDAPAGSTSGTETSGAAPAGTSAEAAPEARTDAEASDTTDDARTPADIESTELTGFSLAFGDPEQLSPAPGTDTLAQIHNTASFTLVLKTEDPLDTASAVTCSISAKPYDTPEDADAQHISFSASYDDLRALQTLVEKEGLIDSYCNFADDIDANLDREFAKLKLLYASGESAYHECNTDCDIDPSARVAVLAFFYDLLDKYDRTFYHHSTGYADEESFVEAFLGQAPWDELSVTDKDGNAVTLTLTSDPTGRVFSLKAGDDLYAGSYKLKKKEDDGRWQLVLTLTQWPAAYTPMTKGGTILIDTEVSGTGGSETLVISKYPNTASLFDPFFGEAGELVFTRGFTSYFEDKPFAADTDATDG